MNKKENKNYGTTEEINAIHDLWHLCDGVANDLGSGGSFDLEEIEAVPEALYKEIKHNIDYYEYYLDRIRERDDLAECIHQIKGEFAQIKLTIEEMYPELFDSYERKISRSEKIFNGKLSRRLNAKIPNATFNQLASGNIPNHQ